MSPPRGAGNPGGGGRGRGADRADGRLVEGAGARRRAGGEGGAAAVVKAVVGGETCGNRLLKRNGDAATYRYRY
jgi:hypothetical protein